MRGPLTQAAFPPSKLLLLVPRGVQHTAAVRQRAVGVGGRTMGSYEGEGEARQARGDSHIFADVLYQMPKQMLFLIFV